MPENAAHLQKAVDFITKFHALQFRKGTDMPYVCHPFEVLKKAVGWGVTNVAHPTVWIAILLHDTLEDTAATYELIADEFGFTVADLVKELTFRPKVPGEAGYQGKKMQHLSDFVNKSPEAIVAKAADRICNVLDFLLNDPEYARLYFLKASGLWSAIRDRESDIEDKFGVPVWMKMVCDIEQLAQRLRVDKVII